MLKWAIILLIAGLILGALGFGGIGGAFVGIAKILFFICIALFVIFLVLGLMAGKKVSDSLSIIDRDDLYRSSRSVLRQCSVRPLGFRQRKCTAVDIYR